MGNSHFLWPLVGVPPPLRAGVRRGAFEEGLFPTASARVNRSAPAAPPWGRSREGGWTRQTTGRRSGATRLSRPTKRAEALIASADLSGANNFLTVARRYAEVAAFRCSAYVLWMTISGFLMRTDDWQR